MNTLVFTLGEHRSQLTLKISTYPNGNLAIKLYEKDHGILIFWETLTTNLTGIRPDHCAFINIKAADGLFPVWLSDNHLAEPTGQILESDGCLYPEYLFYSKELDALDHEGHTLYIRQQKGELGRRFERLYIALRRLAREINGFSYPLSLVQNGPNPFETTSSNSSHFGMGLYSSRILCEKHGGRLILGNQAGGGASATAIFHFV